MSARSGWRKPSDGATSRICKREPNRKRRKDAALQDLADFERASTLAKRPAVRALCAAFLCANSAMKILALDFSTLRRSAAVVDENGRVISAVTQEARRAGSPFPLIAQVLGNLTAADIDAIAVGLGPGSYTGIRSSLAIAQGWNLARNVPCAGISSADAIAFEAGQEGLRGEVEVVIDAQRGEVYSAIYNVNSEGCSLVRALKILPAPETHFFIGPEATRWNEEARIIEPNAVAIGKLAAKSKEFTAPENLSAIYLREPSFVKAPAVRHT